MTGSAFPTEELRALVDAACNGSLTERDAARLEELLAGSVEAQRFYLACVRLDGCLRWEFGHQPHVSEQPLAHIPPIIFDLSPSTHNPLWASLFVPGGFLFCYVVGALLVGIGLLIGWTCRVSLRQQVAPGRAEQAAIAVEPEQPSVGRITGLVDCRCADGRTETFDRAPVRLGSRYALAAGFMEITYDTGAKVILQGPCTYEIESAASGFLSLGKLTARVEGKAEGGGRRAEGEVTTGKWAVNPKSEIRNPKSEVVTPPSALRPPPSDRGSPGERTANLSLAENAEPTTSLAPRPSSFIPHPSSLFSVRTPTAIVTDLGTEFGVEVDRSGVSWAHVFQGKVELQPTQGGKDTRAVQLGANESARVEIGAGRVVRVVGEAGQSNPRDFARQMPSRAPIMRFNTGAGLKEGDPDPHWQIVAMSNDPNFKPRPAVVTAVGPGYQPNDPARWQWISLGNGLPDLPNGVTCTFRTTIEVKGTPRPDQYRSLLQLSILLNKKLKAVRINGEEMSPHQPSNNSRPQADVAVAGTKWRKGVNYLEFDVTNEDPSRADGTSPILLRVSWD